MSVIIGLFAFGCMMMFAKTAVDKLTALIVGVGVMILFAVVSSLKDMG